MFKKLRSKLEYYKTSGRGANILMKRLIRRAYGIKSIPSNATPTQELKMKLADDTHKLIRNGVVEHALKEHLPGTSIIRNPLKKKLYNILDK